MDIPLSEIVGPTLIQLVALVGVLFVGARVFFAKESKGYFSKSYLIGIGVAIVITAIGYLFLADSIKSLSTDVQAVRDAGGEVNIVN